MFDSCYISGYSLFSCDFFFPGLYKSSVFNLLMIRWISLTIHHAPVNLVSFISSYEAYMKFSLLITPHYFQFKVESFLLTPYFIITIVASLQSCLMIRLIFSPANQPAQPELAVMPELIVGHQS